MLRYLLPLLLLACHPVIAVEAPGAAPRPLPAFYPVSPQRGVYDPDRFRARAEAVIALPAGPASEGDLVETVSLNGAWRFSGLARSATPFPDDADLAGGFTALSFDDAPWATIPVPSNFYLKYPADAQAPYAKGWYRKAVAIPAGAAGRRTLLHFGVIGYEALLFVNGKEAGRHHGDFTPWEVDITDRIEPGRTAILALRVFSDLGPSKACGADRLITAQKHGYGSQYWHTNIKGGLWRSVELRLVPAIRVASAQVDPDLGDSSIRISCRILSHAAKTRNLELHAAVVDARRGSTDPSPAPSGRLATVSIAPGDNAIDLRLPLVDPKRWTPDAPELYHLVLALVEDGRTISVKTERFGFRSFATSGDHFLLNGTRLYLFGESIEVANAFERGKPDLDQPDASPAARKVAADILLGYKSRGSNMLRLSEQPVADAVLDLADEVGMMIYDMWCWSYGGKLDPAFEQINAEEVGEWVRCDYNHPAVVMWLGGNEVHCDRHPEAKEIFDRQTRLIRDLDGSRRPVSIFSGSAYGFANGCELDSDLLDLHSYLGLGDNPWTCWERDFAFMRSRAPKTRTGGKPTSVPYVIWELVGFSWGQRSAALKPDDVDDYLAWTKGPTDWGQPNGIGWAGSIGLAAALDKTRGGKHGMEMIGRRIMDFVRQDTRVSGFAPWFCLNSIDLPATSLWTQPVYCGLRDPGGLPLRNVFAGRTYAQNLFVVNSTNAVHTGAVARFSLVEADGQESALGQWELPTIPAWQKLERQVDLALPPGRDPRWAQIRVRILAADGHELSRNFYDIYVRDAAAAMAPLGAAGGFGILACGADGEAGLRRILDRLAVAYQSVTAPEQLAALKVLVVPPSTVELQGVREGSPTVQAITQWVAGGGTLVVLEQTWSGQLALVSRQLRTMPTVFADLVVGSHPAFAGLSQANFEFWNNPAFGQTASVVMFPISRNLLAARGPLLSQRETYGILSDGASGSGRVLSSQFDACALWDIDSAATTYLRNLLLCAAKAPSSPPPPWERSATGFTVAKDADLVHLDLRKQANMGFRDEVAGDGTGGWSDQGDNDFHMMPIGRQTVRGVSFEIIDPAAHAGRSCIALRRDPLGAFVSSVEGIAVGERFSRLFFLHSEAFTSAPPGSPALAYRINYADGTHLDISCVEGVTICDWWTCADLPGARLGIAKGNPKMKGQTVGILAMEWINPRPEIVIASIDALASPVERTISFIVAVTGERFAATPIPVGTGPWTTVAASRVPGEVLKAGPLLPRVETVPGQPEAAIRIRMPAYGPADARPVAFTGFAVLAKDGNARYRYLVMEMQADARGAIEIVLPDREWKTAFRHQLRLRPEDARHTVRIALDDLGFPFTGLRGECYLYAGSGQEAQPVDPVAFRLWNIRFE